MLEPAAQPDASPAARSGRRLWMWLAIGMAMAFAVRLVVGQFMAGGLARACEGDEGDYVALATNLIQGAGYVNKAGQATCYRTPFLPLLLAGMFRVTGPDLTAARVVLCAIGSVVVPVCYFLGRAAAGDRVGLLCGAAAVVYPSWVFNSSAVLTDVPTLILVSVVAWMLVVGGQRNSLAWLAGAGFVWGLATLARATSLIYAPGIGLWLLLILPNWPRRIAGVVATVVPMVCVIVPWCVRNSHAMGAFVLSSQGGMALQISNNPEATGILNTDFHRHVIAAQTRYPRNAYASEIERSNHFGADAKKWIRENPRRFAWLCAVRFVELWKPYSPRAPLVPNLVMLASFGTLLPLFLLQVVRCGWRRGPDMLFVLIIGLQTAAHVVYTAIVRYRMAVEPLIVVMAMAALVWLWERRARRVP